LLNLIALRVSFSTNYLVMLPLNIVLCTCLQCIYQFCFCKIIPQIQYQLVAKVSDMNDIIWRQLFLFWFRCFMYINTCIEPFALVFSLGLILVQYMPNTLQILCHIQNSMYLTLILDSSRWSRDKRPFLFVKVHVDFSDLIQLQYVTSY